MSHFLTNYLKQTKDKKPMESWYDEVVRAMRGLVEQKFRVRVEKREKS